MVMQSTCERKLKTKMVQGYYKSDMPSPVAVQDLTLMGITLQVHGGEYCFINIELIKRENKPTYRLINNKAGGG